MNKDFKTQLAEAYNADAKRREENEDKREDWKLKLRQEFVDLLKQEDKHKILELGAGVGIDSQFFKDNGFDVLSTDLSPEMIEACKKRGLRAKVQDLYHLNELGEKFDAVFSLNVLLHVPRADLEQVLQNIYDVLTRGGIFYYGVYGGMNEEKTVVDKTKMNMPRLFSFLSDDGIRDVTKDKFELLHFYTVDIASKTPGFHFQSLLLKKK